MIDGFVPPRLVPDRLVAIAASTAALGCGIALFFLGDAYALRIGMTLAMYVALASGWNIIGGMAGYPSFATAGFFGLGAYAGALSQQAGIPMGLAWIFAAAVAAAVALAVGWIVLRLRGHYFAIASLAVMMVLRELATNWTELTGGGMGVNLPVLQLSIIAQARLFFAAQAGLAVIAVITSALVASSSLGFALVCIRQNETAAGMLGLDARRAKAVAFALSAAFAGAAGAIYASAIFYIDPSDVFDIQTAVQPIIMAMLGGLGTVAGPVLGAAIYLVLEQTVWANFLSVHAAVLGVLVVALALFLPQGVLGRLYRRKARA
jgi:branched-chain amino acid transport system permease protein